MTQQAYDRFSMPNDIPDNEPPNGVAKALHDLPALIGDLPEDSTRSAQRQFNAHAQGIFLTRLSLTGSVRSAAKSAGTSHQTVYRLRRSCTLFRRAWDAALLVAREQAEEVLAVRAIEGVAEEVWYHGEVVATRRRYDSRLLLAHLARLDRLAERADIAALAQDFDAVLARLEQGGDLAGLGVDEAAGTAGDEGAGDNGSGQCNRRSMSGAGDEDDKVAEEGEEIEDPYFARLDVMEAARPDDAPRPHMLAKGAVRRRRTGSSSCNCRRSRRGWQSGGRSPGRMGREGAALK